MGGEPLDPGRIRCSAAAIREVKAMIDDGTLAAKPTERAFLAGALYSVELLIEDVVDVGRT